jgi:hypothetical protein
MPLEMPSGAEVGVHLAPLIQALLLFAIQMVAVQFMLVAEEERVLLALK